MQTYFFVQRDFPMGGIETLILRMLPLLQADGSRVVVSGSRGELVARLPPDVIVFDGSNEFLSALEIPRFLRESDLPGDLVFVSFNPWSLVNVFIARLLLRTNTTYRIRSMYFVPHSRALFFSGNDHSKDFVRKVFLKAPVASTYFMNDVALAAHASEWNMSLAAWPVLRLPLGERQPTWCARVGDVLKIVSVGRLVPFKGYNRAAPTIVAALRARGIAAEWTLWGDGEDRALIETLIRTAGVEGLVTLRGTLPYDDMAMELERHDLFVGMGTAMLEAALVGIPTICALENGSDEGYGFLPDTPSDSVGDRKQGHPVEPLIETIQGFAALSTAERDRLSQRCTASAQARSASLSAFADAVRNAAPWPAAFSLGELRLALEGLALLALREVRFARARRREARSTR